MQQGRSRHKRVSPGMDLGHCRKRASAMDQKEGNQARGKHPLKTADGGTRRNMERK